MRYVESQITNFISKYRNSIKENFGAIGQFYDFVFLCGKKREPNDNRSAIQKIISKSSFRESLYSEDLFQYMSEIDLLSFEEILLDISVAVIVIIESLGSACELGAFSMVNSNLDKLYVINNRKHIGQQSFINDGPIKKISDYSKKKNANRIFFEKFNGLEENELVISNDLFVELSQIEKKKNFKSKPYKKQDNCIIIEDISYLMWLELDFVKVFGVINVESLYNILLILFDSSEIIIKTDSKNDITNQFVVKETIKFLYKVMENFKLVSIQNDNVYINFTEIKKMGLNINSMTNVLFREVDSKSLSFINDRSRIVNHIKKKGYKIWNY